MTINEKLDSLFSEWKQAMERNGDKGFCYDGLIYRNGREDALWNASKRRIVFLLKEQNYNDGEDVREWTGSINGISPNGNFFHRLSAWLYGLSHVTPQGYPPLDEAFRNDVQMKALREYPYAYVNIKKQTGGARATDSEVYAHAERYATFLREQMNILNANTVVCCGSIVFRAATELIYNNTPIVEKNDWIYHLPQKNITLIHSFHPTASKSNDVMYGEMMDAVKKSLNFR